MTASRADSGASCTRASMLRAPGTKVRMALGNTAQVAAAVRQGTSELGFVERAVDDSVLTSAGIVPAGGVLAGSPSTAPFTVCPYIEKGVL